MDKSRLLYRGLVQHQPSQFLTAIRQPQRKPYICTQCLHILRRPKPSRIPLRQRLQTRNQTTSNPADDPTFKSIVDAPPQLIRANVRHNKWGLLFLACMPLTAFALGCWQVSRLSWKSALIAKLEDRILRDPLPLPPQIDPSAVKDFDYRRIYARGKFRHDQEMLLGPRLRDGEDGYTVVTPLDRSEANPDATGSTTILVCRGWIAKDKGPQSKRPASLPQGEVVVEGLLREPLKKNMFTPKNDPPRNLWHFPDVYGMAEWAGCQPVWVEETMVPDLLASYDRLDKGVPIGRPAEVNLRNKHAEYIFTWFSLAAATTVMMYMVVKRPVSGRARRPRQNKEWS